ncbi:hypothetical protein M8C21_030337 [Ambrosia artemisiifolia]|uniref:cysteine-S-conjugate beta-lyase n=1 Tax=Ambrosia artemisiifolia TaxID=4212 RepID=A0AAD5CPW6_AMBAR|nr:hypothetical protein M8C21_030337 [Ambrosia artemisiifolia]
MASSLLRSPMAPPTDLNNRSGIISSWCKSSSASTHSSTLFAKNYRLTYSRDCNMIAKTSAVTDLMTGYLDETCLTEVVVDKEPSVSTILMNFENEFDPYGATSTPLYQTATFKQSSATEYGAYDYTRGGNPTRDVLETLMAKLDKADRALCFTSGMAALSAVSHLVNPGEEIVAGEDIYGGSDRLLSEVIPKRGVVVKRVDTTNLDMVASAIGPETKLVWLESPTNPQQQISDIRHYVSDIVSTVGTWSRLGEELYFFQNSEGAGLAPFDCWICLRGAKTMALRVERQQENAQKIAEFLASHPLVTKVNYAGLPNHPGHALHYSQAKGAGSVLSFETGSLALSKHVVENTKYFGITVSFGTVKSLISLPSFMSHAVIPKEVRKARGLTDDLIRISVGIEDVDDLIADLDHALKTGPV